MFYLKNLVLVWVTQANTKTASVFEAGLATPPPKNRAAAHEHDSPAHLRAAHPILRNISETPVGEQDKSLFLAHVRNPFVV